MIIREMSGAGGLWLLGEDDGSGADAGGGGGDSGGGGWPSLKDVGKYADQAKQAVDAGKKAVNQATGGGSGSKTGTAKAGTIYFCKSLYDKCKSFVTSTSNQTKFKRLVAAQIAGTAWQAYSKDNLACATQFKSGAFGAFKKGDAKGNAAAYTKYLACQKAATSKYQAASVKLKSDQLWVGTYRLAKDYMMSVDSAQSKGMQMFDSKCSTAAEKQLTARLAKASGSTTTYVVGALVLVGAGVAAWYLI